MKYSEFIDLLTSYSEAEFAEFQKRLIHTERKILGVRTPTLRKIATNYKKDLDEIFRFPNEYYEVVFIKLTMVSALPYGRFLIYLNECIALMDNWALCDSFKAKCLKKHKDEFLLVLESIFAKGGEYEQRYPLVALLNDYVEEAYLSTIERFVRNANTKPYYVHMATAWLISEVLVKSYENGVKLLKKRVVDVKTHNKTIQKAIESYRLTNEQKEFLRSLKIKK